MRRAFAAAGCLLALLAFAALGWASKEYVWRYALPGYHYQFPLDHFEHEDFRTEWWYYTGNVVDAGGKRFGFELVFFRQGVPRPAGKPESPWSVSDVYLAHAAFTDPSGKRFLSEERLNRAGPGIAGASAQLGRIWNGNWSAAWSPASIQILDATTPNFRYHFKLEPETQPVVHGENGVSQKADGAGMASHYVSFPRLRVQGEIQTANAAHQVTGTAWMDHEWFSNTLAANQLGWDWLSIQLDNHTELMLYQFRLAGGAASPTTIDPHSSGTFIDAAGHARHLTYKDFRLTPGRKHGKYPVEWRIEVPSAGIDLQSRPIWDDQQLPPSANSPGYWEGAVDYFGTQKGVGYLEMTGYDGTKPLK